jgi:GxxExxY protein
VDLDDITGAVVNEAIRIHRHLGPGLLESVYERSLGGALQRCGLCVDRQRPVELSHEGVTFKQGFRLDLLVEKRVIVEVKSIERFAPVHTKQLLTYLRLTNIRVGLILNFGAGTMKEGIKRVVNDLDPSTSPRLRINQQR